MGDSKRIGFALETSGGRPIYAIIAPAPRLELGIMYDHKTGDILVSVEPFFLDEQSTPEDGHFVWAYSVKIENHGSETVQLINRYWRTASRGRVPGADRERAALRGGDHPGQRGVPHTRAAAPGRGDPYREAARADRIQR